MRAQRAHRSRTDRRDQAVRGSVRLRRLDLSIERGRKVALVGPNGAGKSTLIKLLAGSEPLTAGERKVGHNVTTGYFAQDQTHILDPDRTVLDEITAAAPYDMVPQVRQLLGAFLFGGDSVYKPIKVLSGGERNRLALCKLLLEPSNCLLLDEPTNHLDISAKEVLLEALQNYGGSLVLVAHDRYILDHYPKRSSRSAPVTPCATSVTTRTTCAARQGRNRTARRDPGRQHRCGKCRTALPSRRLRKAAGTRPGSARRHGALLRLSSSATGRSRDSRDRSPRRKEELSAVSALINQADFYRTHDDPHAVFSRYAQLKKEVEGLYGKLERLERQREEVPNAVPSDRGPVY